MDNPIRFTYMVFLSKKSGTPKKINNQWMWTGDYYNIKVGAWHWWSKYLK